MDIEESDTRVNACLGYAGAMGVELSYHIARLSDEVSLLVCSRCPLSLMFQQMRHQGSYLVEEIKNIPAQDAGPAFNALFTGGRDL